MSRPFCFALMPTGRGSTPSGLFVDFDAVRREVVVPAIEAAGLVPWSPDAEAGDAALEALVLSEHAVVDLTLAGPGVFYALGLRHASRPEGVVVMFAWLAGGLPFGLAGDLAYSVAPDGRPAAASDVREALAARLRGSAPRSGTSAVFRLLESFAGIERLKTDVFRERIGATGHVAERIARARGEGVEALRETEAELGAISGAGAAVAVDLLLSYRAVKAWDEMIALVERMPPPLAATALVQEQLGLALNRAGRSAEAERTLVDLIARRGPSSETCGILGRVYKDGWEAARARDDEEAARQLLDRAIDAYLAGFEADSRDAYPGINALTLMELRDAPDPRGAGLSPIVAWAVNRRIASGAADYWDRATRLELAVLGRDERAARAALDDALAAAREPWEAESTARNLRLIREARERRGEPATWEVAVEERLARWAGNTEPSRRTP